MNTLCRRVVWAVSATVTVSAVMACGSAGQHRAKTAGDGSASAAGASPDVVEGSDEVAMPRIVIPKDPVGLLPASCQVAVYLEGKALRDVPQVRRLLNLVQGRESAGDAEMAHYFFERTDALVIGMDLVSDPNEVRTLVVVRGRFEESRVLGAFGADKVGEAARDAHGFAVLDRVEGVVTRLLDEQTLVATHPDLWAQVVTGLEGEARGDGVGDKLQEVPAFRRLATQAEFGAHGVSAVVVVSKPLQAKIAAASRRQLALAALGGMVSTVTGGVGTVDLGEGGEVALTIHTESGEQADALASLGRLLQGSIVHAVSEPVVRELVRRATIESDGTELRLVSSVTERELDVLVEGWMQGEDKALAGGL